LERVQRRDVLEKLGGDAVRGGDLLGDRYACPLDVRDQEHGHEPGRKPRDDEIEARSQRHGSSRVCITPRFRSRRTPADQENHEARIMIARVPAAAPAPPCWPRPMWP